MAPRILLLMGMKPDRRIFRELLPLLPDAAVLDWIEPLPNESLVAYARRLADTLPAELQVRRRATDDARFVQPDIILRGGGHLLPLTHAREIASAINEFRLSLD